MEKLKEKNINLSASGRLSIQMPMNSEEKTDNMKRPRPLRVLDIVIIIALLFVSVAFIPFMGSQSHDTVVVYKRDDVIAEYRLDQDRVFHVDGIDGTLEIEIRNEKVRVQSSPCRHQVCVNTGWISRSYEQIICAPNLVHLLIHSNSEEEEIDAVTYGE
jgi:hypothetical protein